LAQADDGQMPLSSRTIAAGEPVMLIRDAAVRDQRLKELRRWVHDYGDWQDWRTKWRNTREPGWFGSRDRRPRPDPPEWVVESCSDQLDDADDLVAACALLADWNADEAAAKLRQQLAMARAQREAPTKSLWWEHVHVDAAWPMTQWRSSVYGVIGMHATIEVAGRFEVFVAPGAMVLSLPAPGGAHELKPAADWGFAYRLFDFTFPGTSVPCRLHLNLARAWIFGGPSRLMESTIDLAGFSVTFKKD
jgi:hypothetical protein